MTFIVDGNWTDAVKNSGLSQSNSVYNINYDTGYPNPAPECTLKQNFTASYKCGNETTARNISIQDAIGKPANFDCADLITKCSGLTLNLDDTGKLSVKDANGDVKWNSDSITKNPINNPLVLEENKPANNPYYKDRSYLNSGEFLTDGQYLSSPSGKFRLEMITTTDNLKTLQVVYNSGGCSSTDPIDQASSKLYTIPWSYRETLGSMGFVNDQGKLQLYDSSITATSYSPNFTKLTNADANNTTYGIYGGDLGSATTVADSNACKTNCTNANNCIGFEYEKIGKTCQLKTNDAIINGIRRVNTNPLNGKDYEYYSRMKTLSGLDASCPSSSANISSVTTDYWNTLLGSKSDVPMTSTVKCGLGKVIDPKRAAVVAAETTLNTYTGPFSETINNMYNKYHNLKLYLAASSSILSNVFDDLSEKKQILAMWNETGDKQSEQLDAMNEDRDLSMMSKNYKHIMWSILAIIIIIVIIYLTKSFGNSTTIEMPKLEMPKLEMPKLEMPKLEMPKLPSATAAAAT
jgi:hypothetical protein